MKTYFPQQILKALGGSKSVNLGVLSLDGVLDGLDANGIVNALAVQADGKFVVAGSRMALQSEREVVTLGFHSNLKQFRPELAGNKKPGVLLVIGDAI